MAPSRDTLTFVVCQLLRAAGKWYAEKQTRIIILVKHSERFLEDWLGQQEIESLKTDLRHRLPLFSTATVTINQV